MNRPDVRSVEDYMCMHMYMCMCMYMYSGGLVEDQVWDSGIWGTAGQQQGASVETWT